MKGILKKFAEASVAELWNLISRPSMIPVILSAPSSVSNTDAIRLLFPGLTQGSIQALRLEFLENEKFFAELNKKMIKKRNIRTACGGSYEFLYMSVRSMKPKVVFETGVFDGHSSAVILQALSDNNEGILVSVDLPATEAIKNSTDRMDETTLPPGYDPGWIVPDYLRSRYRLVLGDSRQLLPQLFKEYPNVDIFLHDSLHTFEHQYFEYATAWPHLPEGGLLLSDDIFWSPAFHRFCKEKGMAYLRLIGFGILKK
jgi:predicted O-methyltransferase YrrM